MPLPNPLQPLTDFIASLQPVFDFIGNLAAFVINQPILSCYISKSRIIKIAKKGE
jgi:hypothetical protein